MEYYLALNKNEIDSKTRGAGWEKQAEDSSSEEEDV